LDEKVFSAERLNTQFADIYQLQNSASSSYNGVSFTLNRRMSDELAFSASYTLSKTFDDASDFDEQPQNPFDPRAENAVSRQHQQQRFVFNALWDLPIGDEEEKGGKSEENTGWLTQAFSHIEVSPILTLESGRPVNPLTGLDLNQSHAFPLGKAAGPREKLSEHTSAGHDGLPHPEVFPVRRRETSRRGSGILQLVQQFQRLPGQSGVRLRFDSDTRISAADCRIRCAPNPVLSGLRVLTDSNKKIAVENVCEFERSFKDYVDCSN
jgi:hypothetical protein